jgi:hypothetical protein
LVDEEKKALSYQSYEIDDWFDFANSCNFVVKYLQ